MNRGEILNFDRYISLIEDVYESKLKTQPSNYSLLLTESSIQNSQQRQKLCEIAFETLNISNFFIIKSAVLSCFSSGRQTAMIVDVGSNNIYTVPVHDGYALQKSTIKANIGGEDITRQLL